VEFQPDVLLVGRAQALARQKYSQVAYNQKR
jgi:hypothetical protein